MTDSETHELVGRKREEYRLRKKERAALKAKSSELGEFAAKISTGLKSPEMIRWFDGTPAIGRTPQHIVLTERMFEELNPVSIKQTCADLRRLEAVLGALRQELTTLDDDPGPF